MTKLLQNFSLSKLKNWRQWRLTTVVLGGIVVGLTVPTIAFLIVSTTTQRSKLLNSAAADHERVTGILSIAARPGLWNLDVASTTKLLDSAMTDQRVVSATIYDDKGGIFLSSKDEKRRSGDVVKKELPVMNDDKAIGKVIVEFSLSQAYGAVHTMIMQQFAQSMVQLLICLAVLISLMNGRVISRLKKIREEANALASKKLDHPFLWSDGDEVGDLGKALEITRTSLKGLFEEIEAKNKELASINLNLEKIVAERTATIKMILENVKNGFLVVGKDMKVQDGFSRSCIDLLETKDISSRVLPDILKLAKKERYNFEANVDQVFEDILPEDLSLEQIPARHRLGNRALSVQASTIRDPKTNEIKNLLFSITDVTALEAAEVENQRSQAIIRILRNLQAFRDYIQEFRARVIDAMKAQEAGDEKVLRRELHTLKGNSAAFGLQKLVTFIHGVEDMPVIGKDSVVDCEKQMKAFLEENFKVLKVKYDERDNEEYTLTKKDIESMKAGLQTVKNAEARVVHLLDWVHMMQMVPVSSLVGQYSDYVAAMSERVGKKAELIIDGGDVRVDPKRFKHVMNNLTHLIRNSIDHGIESPANRGTKKPVAEIRLSFKRDGDKLSITVSDDGGGINTEKLYQKAVKEGIFKESDKPSQSQIIDLIYRDKMSTADSINEISGRGVGMGAVKDAIESLDGDMKVETKQGFYTKFLINLPIEEESAKVENIRRSAA